MATRTDHGEAPPARRPTNVSLKRGLTEEVKEARARVWLEENGAALESYNAYIEKNGLPLKRYRKF
jgi:post-segregation antitoxin (ccd killing protein)